MNFICLLITLTFLSLSGFCQATSTLSNWEDVLLSASEKKEIHISSYPNFTDNPCINQHMQRRMTSYLLPLNSPLKPVLDEIFASSGVIADENSLEQAGFSILYSQKRSFIIVAKHPKVQGYLFKIYLDSRKVHKDNMVGWELLTTRCIVARKIKGIIRKQKIRHFTVADKWLYPVPPSTQRRLKAEPVVLVVKDMQIHQGSASKRIWQKKVTRSHLNELYAILGKGYGSPILHRNVPYTKSGKFAFIDTEYNRRKIHMTHVKRFLSPEMRSYWDYLMQSRAHGILYNSKMGQVRIKSLQGFCACRPFKRINQRGCPLPKLP